MHRIDTVGHIGNKFDDGTPPADGTICNDEWLNAVQEELCNFIEAYGQTLVKGEPWTQLQDAMKVHARDEPVVYSSSGSSGGYAITTSPPITSYAEGMKFIFKANHNNPHLIAYLNVDSLGTKEIRGSGNQQLVANSLESDRFVYVIYNSWSSCFHLLADHSDNEIDDARGSSTSLNNRISNALDGDGYVNALSSPGGNCLVQCWAYWDAVGATPYKTYNMSIAKFGGAGQYSVIFTNTTYTGANDYILLYNAETVTGKVLTANLSARTATSCTLTTYEDGVATTMNADHSFAFIGTVH